MILIKRHIIIGFLTAIIFLLGACASKPLKTSQTYPTNIHKKQDYKRVALIGFSKQSKYREFSNAMNEYLTRVTGKHVQKDYYYSPKKLKGTSDLALVLKDIYHKEKILATQRRYWNMYFTCTLVAFWMIPLSDAMDFWRSELQLVAELELYDINNDKLIWSGDKIYNIKEKPTGVLGPDREKFRGLLLRRASQNLASNLVNDLSQYLIIRPKIQSFYKKD